MMVVVPFSETITLAFRTVIREIESVIITPYLQEVKVTTGRSEMVGNKLETVSVHCPLSENRRTGQSPENCANI